jgi:hypothetical protein
MTIRWQTGKEPTKSEIKSVITNAVRSFSLRNEDVESIANAVHRFYKDRIEGRK